MRTLSIKEARINISRLVSLAAKGETVVITRNGKEAARLCAMPPRAKALPSLSEFRAGVVRPEHGLTRTVIASRREARF